MYAELKRTCGNCRETKPLDAFYKNLAKEGRCKSCVSRIRKEAYRADPAKVIARVTKYRTENPEKIKDTKLKQDRGVDLTWFKSKLEEQNHACACCKKPETMIWRGRKVALSVDHDHGTGAVRALLCTKCNRALGLLKEDPQIIQSLLDYILKFKKQG